MLWTQACIGFLIWIGYGVWFVQKKTAQIEPRGTVAGPLLLIVGMLVLAVAMYGIYALGGLQNGSLTPLALVGVIVAGLMFVHCQCLGARLILSQALSPETRNKLKTSDSEKDIE